MTDAHPRMALGTMHFGTRLPAAQSREILDAYLDLGGQWIDTANCYAFWGSESGLGGQSETVIGQWLADRGVRDQVKISTKVGAEPTRPHGFPGAVEGLGDIRDRLLSILHMGPVHVDALRLQALQAVPDGSVDSVLAEAFHGVREGVGAGRLRTGLGTDPHLAVHTAISEPLADDGLTLAPEAGLGSPEGVAVRGVDPLAAQIQVGVEDLPGLDGRQAGSEVHGAQRHAGVCVSHRGAPFRVIRVSGARRASDRNRFRRHQQELQGRHEYASSLKKMLISTVALSALRARGGVLLLEDPGRGAGAALLVAITRSGSTGRVAVGRGPAGSTGASSRTALSTGATLAPTGTTTGHLASRTALPTRTTLAVSGLALSVMTTGVTAVVKQ